MIDHFQNKPFDCKLLNIRYLAIPKNASSFIKTFIYNLNNFNECYKNNNFILNAHEVYKNKYGYQIPSFRNKPIIVFIRNPISRFISGFNDRILRRKEILSDIEDNHEKLEIFINNFDFFIKNCPAMKWHFSPQFYFFKNYINAKNIQFFNVDDINVVLKSLLNKSNPDEKIRQYYDEIKRKRKNKTPKEFSWLSPSKISSEYLKKLEHFYSKDIEIFNQINL